MGKFNNIRMRKLSSKKLIKTLKKKLHKFEKFHRTTLELKRKKWKKFFLIQNGKTIFHFKPKILNNSIC